LATPAQGYHPAGMSGAFEPAACTACAPAKLNATSNAEWTRAFFVVVAFM